MIVTQKGSVRMVNNMTLAAFQDMARELISSTGYRIDVARGYAETFPDGECHALECSVETWGPATYGAPRVECIYWKYADTPARIWISMEDKP